MIRECLLLGLSVAAAAQPRDLRLSVTVRVYDYAGLPAKVLTRAEREAALVYRRIGVNIHWASCPGCEGLGLAAVTLRFLPKSMEGRLRESWNAFGSAQLPDDGGPGGTANVFADRAREMAKGDSRLCDALLGNVVAHELGHLLLGMPGHAVAGIMAGNWRSPDLLSLRQRGLFFLPAHAARIRAQIARWQPQ